MCLSRLPFGRKAQSIAIVCVALLDSQLRWKSLKQICRSDALEFDGVESQRLETGSRALKTAKTFQHVAIAMPAIGLLPLFSQTQDAQPDRTQKAASNFVLPRNSVSDIFHKVVHTLIVRPPLPQRSTVFAGSCLVQGVVREPQGADTCGNRCGHAKFAACVS
jgi:hypothetical protein